MSQNWHQELGRRVQELKRTPDTALRLEVNNFWLWYFSEIRKGQDWYQDIVDFHEQVMEDDFPKKPHIPSLELKELRGTLIIEEIEETLNAMDEDNLVEIADGIADSIVVLLGAAITYGIDMRPIWDEVHRTNMAKKGGARREDGKLLKSTDWTPPKIREILEKQGMKTND